MAERHHHQAAGAAFHFCAFDSIQRAVASQRWRRVHWGIYATQPGLLDLPQRQRVAVLAAGADLPATTELTQACLGGISALQRLGLRDLAADAIHVLVPTGRQVRHLNVRHMWDDAARQNSLELDGYLVLRYPAFVVRGDPQRVAADIREALIRAGWRP